MSVVSSFCVTGIHPKTSLAMPASITFTKTPPINGPRWGFSFRGHKRVTPIPIARRVVSSLSHPNNRNDGGPRGPGERDSEFWAGGPPKLVLLGWGFLVRTKTPPIRQAQGRLLAKEGGRKQVPFGKLRAGSRLSLGMTGWGTRGTAPMTRSALFTSP